MHVHFKSPKSGPCQGRHGIGFGERVSVGRPESLILKRFGIFDGESDGVDPVSYTHLTLPTNREV